VRDRRKTTLLAHPGNIPLAYSMAFCMLPIVSNRNGIVHDCVNAVNNGLRDFEKCT